MTTKQAKQRLRDLIAGDAEPVKLKTTEAIGVRQGRTIIKLINDAGEQTAAGQFWQANGGKELPAGGFLQQTPTRVGNTETVRLRSGKRVITRRWDPGSGEFRFTKEGNRFYAAMPRRNYVVSVPVVVEGKRKNGSTYKVKSHMPISKLGIKPAQIPLSMSEGERAALIKQIVKKQLPAGALLEVSDERWLLDESGTGSWKVSEELVAVDPETGHAEAHVSTLDRRIGARPVAAHFPFLEELCDEAYEDRGDMLCAPRQLAKVLQLKEAGFDDLCSDFDAIAQELYPDEPSWRETGATPRIVMEFAKRNGYGCAVVHNGSVIEQRQGKPIIAFVVHENHCFFYEGLAARRALLKRKVQVQDVRPKKQQRPPQTPPTSEWQKWNCEIGPGHFWVTDEDGIDAVRRWFLEVGRSPKVLLKDERRARALVYHLRKKLDGSAGVCYVHELPKDAEKLVRWLEKLDIGLEFCGQGLPSLSLQVLQLLVKKNHERVWLSGEQKAELLERFNFRCAVCDSRGELEFDHVLRFSEGYGEQEFQPLCVNCHKEKTERESRSCDGDHVASFFEREVWSQYVCAPRQPPMLAKLREVPGISGFSAMELRSQKPLIGFEIADVIRCRRNALLHNPHPIPVFCPLDKIQRATTAIGDLNYFTAKYRNCIHQLGYTGPGWYSRIAAEWLLHTSVCKWGDLEFILDATAHLPAGLLCQPLEQMEAAWENQEREAKLSVNSLIGLWNIDESLVFTQTSSSREDDAPNQTCLKSTFHYGGGFIYDFITSTKLVSNASCRPLHDLCLCTEMVRVGQMLLALKHSRAIPYELKTDSILYKPLRRKKPNLQDVRYRDLDMIYTRSMPLAQPDVQMTGLTSETPVFRVGAACARDLMLSRPESLPQRSPHQLELMDRSWCNLQPDIGEASVLRGESLLILGLAGTGKTTYVRGLVERLRADGKSVDIISKTHTAAKRAGGVTADHWVRRYLVNGSPTCQVLWIDEISQLDIGLLLQLAKLLFTDMQFIISGDFNQFAPIGSNFRGTVVTDDSFQNSNLLHSMAGGNRVTLTECRRSESELFRFYASLVECGSRVCLPLSEAIHQAKAQFKYSGFCRWNLVISHRKRILINERINKEMAPRDPNVVKLEVVGRTYRGNCGQPMIIWPGIQLLACVSTRRGISTGCLYTVSAVDAANEELELQELGAKITFDQAKQWLRLSFCQTYASCQGTEFDGQLRLHDVGHRFFTRKHLFVGLSRARAARDVSVVE